MLGEYPGLWMAAHVGGWPEDLEFLDGLSRAIRASCSTRRPRSGWCARSRAIRGPRCGVPAAVVGAGALRLDIVTGDEHLAPEKGAMAGRIFSDLASSPEQAFDLYASRYYALRTMWETGYDGPSPIADPDLMMVDPAKHDEMSAPRLRGLSLPADMLRTLYAGAADSTVMAHIDGV